MKLSNYFKGIGAKRLSDVEIAPIKSNQHELNGINKFKEMFGEKKAKFSTKFIYISDEEQEGSFDIIESEGTTTWYDARENHDTRTEYRLYYSTNEAINQSRTEDLLILAQTPDNTLKIIIAQKDSTAEKQLLWLFGVKEVVNKFVVHDYGKDDKEISFLEKQIIESIGINVDETDDSYLEEMLHLFNGGFPLTKIFSKYARSKVEAVNSVENPDLTLIRWYEKEEILFRTLEKHLVQEVLNSGDIKDVDTFISFSLSLHQRRKSRAGRAFENHLECIFSENNINYSRGKVTEDKKKPDFIFPGINEYHNKEFNEKRLTMLGVKTTAKDRWRQILPEADRIQPKHLITLQAPISKNQTDEMTLHNVILVLPNVLLEAYADDQKKQILTFGNFIKEVQTKQKV